MIMTVRSRTVKTGLLSVAAVLAFTSAGFAAGNRGSMEDQLACTGDVYRLCSQYVPDEDSIVACLKRNVSSLSAGCHRVFTRPDSPSKGDDED